MKQQLQDKQPHRHDPSHVPSYMMLREQVLNLLREANHDRRNESADSIHTVTNSRLTWMNNMTQCCEPMFFRLSQPQDCLTLHQLLNSQIGQTCHIVDTMRLQLKDLVKMENPSLFINSTFSEHANDSQQEALYSSKISEKLQHVSCMEDYGVWVYYPWRNVLCHLLDEEEFIKVRTIRNAHKITLEEQDELKRKKIGVVGLSVGHAVALTLAMERGCGELRLADFDTLELTNMNRLRAKVYDLGLLKGVITKREIAEIDPFLKVVIFNQGINKKNISQFLGVDDETNNNKLDLVIDECDSFDIKVQLRLHCQKFGIPVVMEASDRGCLDIERFDLDQSYPILHGRISQEYLKPDMDLDVVQRKKLITQFLDPSQASERGLKSYLEIGKTITTWPQLASDVSMGGAVVAMASRMILLKMAIPSQRNYLDVSSMIQAHQQQYAASVWIDKMKRIWLMAKCVAKSLK
ncbi:hypothetical protein C9374_013219 [Naegleria lovaniensis]|uniref:THIF-type NAD/FAD binding fold domain-containing protein n=1 Tax=Naegleria lovaniensis TaxID=51637 RepID=A0AA88G6E4_NAELO|nr:uncharacterized protein C9374_013219 [Naegleria lovaniensis]KAG2372767.1 hypothetical protein C9374_013219 [Naegleria lovaniensis]